MFLPHTKGFIPFCWPWDVFMTTALPGEAEGEIKFNGIQSDRLHVPPGAHRERCTHQTPSPAALAPLPKESKINPG